MINIDGLSYLMRAGGILKSIIVLKYLYMYFSDGLATQKF